MTDQGQVITEWPQPPFKIDTSGYVIFEIEPEQQQPQWHKSLYYAEFLTRRFVIVSEGGRDFP